MLKFASIFALVLTFLFVPAFNIATAEQIQVITDNGNVFTFDLPENASSEETDAGISNIDAIGSYATIKALSMHGDVAFGSSVGGTSTIIRPYVEVETGSTFAVVYEEGDSKTTTVIPEFGAEYNYNAGTLQNIGSLAPNVLSISQSRTEGGNISISTDVNGLKFTGTGVAIVQLGGVADKFINFKGNGPAEVFLTTLGPHNYMTLPYEDGKGFLVDSETDDESTSTQVHRHGQCCKVRNWITHTDTWSITPVLTSEQANTITWAGEDKNRCINMQYAYNGGIYRWFCAAYSAGQLNLHGTTVGNHYEAKGGDQVRHLNVRGDWYSNHISRLPPTLGTVPIHVYDKGVYFSSPEFDWTGLSAFEQGFQFSTAPRYLVVEQLNGGTTTVKGEGFNPTAEFLKINNLPANIPFKIIKNDIVLEHGLTTSDGKIILNPLELETVDSSTGAVLELYTSSQFHRATFGNGSVMFDLVNDDSLFLNISDNLVIIPHTFAKISFPTAISVTSVNVDNINFAYLEKDYEASESIMIPIIPGLQEITLLVNDTPVTIQIADLPGLSQIKPIPEKTAITSSHSRGATAASSDASSTSFVIAPQTGTQFAIVEASVSGEAEFSMSAKYTGPINKAHQCKTHGASSPYRSTSCSTYYWPADATAVSGLSGLTADHQVNLMNSINKGKVGSLSVYVDVFVNGEYIKTEKTLDVRGPSASYADSKFGGGKYSSGYNVKLTYPVTHFQKLIEVPVDVGDMVEFVVRANLEVRADPAPTATNTGTSSYVIAETSFHGGSIITGIE